MDYAANAVTLLDCTVCRIDRQHGAVEFTHRPRQACLPLTGESVYQSNVTVRDVFYNRTPNLLNYNNDRVNLNDF